MAFGDLITKALSSGATTPESKTPSSSVPPQGLHRSDSQETITSTMTTINETDEARTVVSIDSYDVPGVPLNTPLGPRSQYDASLAGDKPNEIGAESLHEKLQGMPNSVETNTPPASVRGRTKGNYSQLKSSPFKGTRGTNTPPAIVEFPEHSTWAGVAEEDVTSGLKRLTMLAKDENKLNPSKSVSEYFSERLAKLIKEAEPDFNPKALE